MSELGKVWGFFVSGLEFGGYFVRETVIGSVWNPRPRKQCAFAGKDCRV